MKPLFIIQPLFLGDIFFCMKIAAVEAAKGQRVVFPIHAPYAILLDYLILPYGVEMPLTTDDFEFKGDYERISSLSEQASASGDFCYHQGPFETENAFYLALSSSWRKTSEIQTMRLKYEIAGVDHRDWPDYVKIRRDYDKEAALSKFVGLNGAPFILLNEQGRTNHRPVPITGSIIRMASILGYSMFDWSGIIEAAAEIITIDTAVVLLVEVLKPKAKLQVFSRYVPGDDFKQLSGVLTLDWHLANSINEIRVNQELAVWNISN